MISSDFIHSGVRLLSRARREPTLSSERLPSALRRGQTEGLGVPWTASPAEREPPQAGSRTACLLHSQGRAVGALRRLPLPSHQSAPAPQGPANASHPRWHCHSLSPTRTPTGEKPSLHLVLESQVRVAAPSSCPLAFFSLILSIVVCTLSPKHTNLKN